MSHHPTQAKQPKIQFPFGPCSAPPDFPTQTNHGLLPLATAGAERICGTLKEPSVAPAPIIHDTLSEESEIQRNVEIRSEDKLEELQPGISS